MRTRTRGSLQNLSHSQKETIRDWNCSISKKNSGLPYPIRVGRLETMTDVVTPGYASRSARGEVIINPMAKVIETRNAEFSTRSYYLQYTPGPNPHPCTRTATTPESTKAMEKLFEEEVSHLGVDLDVGSLGKIAGTTAKANVDDPTFEGAIFLAELRETISFLRNPLANWNEFLREVRNAKRRKRAWRNRSVIDFIGNHWLAYRYAVRPLANDVQNAISAIKNVGGSSPRATARGSASDSGSRTEVHYYIDDTGAHYGGSTVTNVTVEIRCGILYEYARSANTFGVRFSDLPGAAWEAIGFSFIVDWFANIGPYINAITPEFGVKILGTWTTTTKSEQTLRTASWVQGGTSKHGHPRVITAPGLTMEEVSTFTKSRRPGIVSGLAFRRAPLAGDIGKGRIADLLAIGNQLLRSK